MRSFFWKRNCTSKELDALLSTLADEFPLNCDGEGTELVFEKSGAEDFLSVENGEKRTVVKFGSLRCAARGTGLALAGLDATEKAAFPSLGFMLDCSRNAVMTVDHLKRWLRRLALMGFNQGMLYTEDTYELPGEPYFGFLRGPYTMKELKEIDAFAGKLGIEMRACVQTLGHLAQVLKWDAYRDVRDSGDVLLVDEPKSYALIDKMLAFWSEAFSSRQIHIGMDEAHSLGRGRFLDKFGYERGFDIFNRHLAKVSGLCQARGLSPMIWSDMYFRMGSVNMEYYDLKCEIPADVKRNVPSGVKLVYWDYYHRDEKFYAEWIKRHRELGGETLMASGVWTWSRWWYDAEITEATVKPCVDACVKAGVKEMVFTLWGDNGAYCEFDSCLAGLCWAAELSFGGDGNEGKVASLFKAATGGSYENYLAASRIEQYDGEKNYGSHELMQDDPLLAVKLKELKKADPASLRRLIESYLALERKLAGARNDVSWADLKHAWLTARLLASKIQTATLLAEAYARKDKDALALAKDKLIPEVLANLRDFASSFRAQWLRRNKPFGLEFMQTIFGGMAARWEEAALRLEEFLAGRADSIPELECGWDEAKDA